MNKGKNYKERDQPMEFNEIMTNILRILEMLDKIYHAVVKEEEDDV